MGFMANQHALAFTFGMLGNVISFMVFLAPIPTFYRIYKKKSTEGFQCLPYLVALFSSMLWLYYAMTKRGAVFLITINSFGCFIESIYIVMFILYAPKEARKLTLRLFLAMNVSLLAFIVLVTQFAIKSHMRAQVLGWICVAISVSVFAAPLSIVAQVIRTKSVEFMPLNLSLFLTLSAIMWFAYGLFMKDICIALPNVIGFILGIVQMLLYACYRNGKSVKGEKKKVSTEPLKNIVKPLGALEVYPEDAAKPIDINVHDIDEAVNKGKLEKQEEQGEREENSETKVEGNLGDKECPV